MSTKSKLSHALPNATQSDRKTYSTPHLVTHGDLKTLTKGVRGHPHHGRGWGIGKGRKGLGRSG